MAKLSFPSASNRHLCKLYQLTTSPFLPISKCKRGKRGKKIPVSKKKNHKPHHHKQTTPTRKHIYIYAKCIPLQNKLYSSACKHDLTNALELLRSYSIFHKWIRRAYESHKPGNCMQIANRSKTRRFGKILLYAQLNLAYLEAQLHIVWRNK